MAAARTVPGAPLVVPTRPYEPLGMTTARWRLVPLTVVRVKDLIVSQDQLSLSAIWAVARGRANRRDRWPHVVRYDGRLWLVDGHHRVTVAVCRGRKKVIVRLLERS